MKELFIYCAGGFGKEVMDVARRVNERYGCWSSISFIDDNPELEREIYGSAVYSFDQLPSVTAREAIEIVVSSGEPRVRCLLSNKIEQAGYALARVVDLSTLVAPTAQLEAGVVITPMCSVSSNAILRLNSSVNTLSIVGHDVDVGENTVISSMVNIGGATKIGNNSYIGMGALIKQGVAIGDDVIVGMGSVVFNDIESGVIALGNPARPMRKNVDGKVFK